MGAHMLRPHAAYGRRCTCQGVPRHISSRVRPACTPTNPTQVSYECSPLSPPSVHPPSGVALTSHLRPAPPESGPTSATRANPQTCKARWNCLADSRRSPPRRSCWALPWKHRGTLWGQRPAHGLVPAWPTTGQGVVPHPSPAMNGLGFGAWNMANLHPLWPPARAGPRPLRGCGALQATHSTCGRDPLQPTP